MSILQTLLSGTSQGLMWAIMALGVYLTYRLLDFADLTVEGSFPLGAAVSVVLINAGASPFVAILCAFAAGAAAGFCTGAMNTVCKIPPILSGILTMIALYSINLRVMGGRATIGYSNDTIKTIISKILPIESTNGRTAIFGIVICALFVLLLYLFFGTEIGAAIRATGQNSSMARAVGVNTGAMTILTLMLSNGFVALSGSLISQIDYGSAQVTMGQGSIVIGLASVIIGERIFCRKDRSFLVRLSAIVFGAVIYRCIFAFAMRVDFLETTDLKFITAVIIIFALTVPQIKAQMSRMKLRRASKNTDVSGGDTNA